MLLCDHLEDLGHYIARPLSRGQEFNHIHNACQQQCGHANPWKSTRISEHCHYEGI